MFRCFLQPRSTSFTPKWLPSLHNVSSGSRGLLRLSDVQARHPAAAPLRGPGLRNTWHFLNTLKLYGIQNHTALRSVKSLSKYSVAIRICPKHARNVDHDQYFGEVGHAHAEALTRRYVRDHREKPLWTNVHCLSPLRAIVRGRFSKRVLSAWKQALRNSGYDNDGASLAEGGRELFGTVEIRTHEPLVALATPWLMLREHFEKVIKTLERDLGQPARGKDALKRNGSVGSGIAAPSTRQPQNHRSQYPRPEYQHPQYPHTRYQHPQRPHPQRHQPQYTHHRSSEDGRGALRQPNARGDSRPHSSWHPNSQSR